MERTLAFLSQHLLMQNGGHISLMDLVYAMKGLCIRTGEIVWANGGLPCDKRTDLRLARNAFIGRLQPGEKALADGG